MFDFSQSNELMGRAITYNGQTDNFVRSQTVKP